jgi:hypothetical protein
LEAHVHRSCDYGAMSKEQAVEDFQKLHRNHLGEKLGVDGVRGPQTQWAEALVQHHPIRQAIVAHALKYLGEGEDPPGSNRSDFIDMILRRCGVPIPEPGVPAPQNAWCAAFASYVLTLAGVGEVKYARVVDLVSHFPEVDFDFVLPGDLGYRINFDQGTGHVWIVSGRQGTNTMNVEGNTGNVVAVTQRPRAKYLRTVAPPTMPGIPPGVPLAGTSTR